MHNLNLQTLVGVQKYGDEIVAMLLAPNVNVQKIRLESIASDPQKCGELCIAINSLRDNLRVLALSYIKFEGSK